MQRLTEQQAIVIMGFTGITTIPFSKFHEDAEKRLGRPIFTHEFGNQQFFEDSIKAAYSEDFFGLCPV
jgi:hypothetical protein